MSWLPYIGRYALGKQLKHVLGIIKDVFSCELIDLKQE